MDTKDLIKRNKSFWTGQATSGANGLALMAENIDHITNTGDWTPLAYLLAAAGTDRPKVSLIIRAAFGDRIKVVKDKKQPSGIRFVMLAQDEDENPVKWNALPLSNSFGVVRKAVEDRVSFRSASFLKNLREAVGVKDKAKPDEAALLKAMARYVTKKAEEGELSVAQIMKALPASLEAYQKEQAQKAA